MKSLAKQVLEASSGKLSESVVSGYWISPYGEVFPVDQNHINTIIENPGKFGYTGDEIKSIYKKHKEVIGSEGNAREEIILDAVRKGWIRVRCYKNVTWTVNIHRLNKRVKDHITNFFQMISKSIPHISGEVSIDTSTGVEYYTPKDIANYALYNEGFKGPVSNKITIKESIHDD